MFVTAYRVAQEAGEYESIISGELPSGWEDALPTFTPEDKGLATRLHSQTMLNALASAIPGQCAFAQSHGNFCCTHRESCIACLPAPTPRNTECCQEDFEGAFGWWPLGSSFACSASEQPDEGSGCLPGPRLSASA